MAIDYSKIRVIDNIPKNPTPEQQKALDRIDTEIARYCVKRLLDTYSTDELDVALPLLVEVEKLVNEGMNREAAKKQVIENYYSKLEQRINEKRCKNV